MALEREIHRLLFTHDCVIVPGFGGFLTHYRPARLDDQRQTIHPPAKDLSFNRHLVRTDGLLTDQVAKRDGVDFVEAGRSVDEAVEGWKKKLEAEGRLELGRIGTFFRDAERNLQFEPDKRVNFLKEAYGLRSVPAVPLVVPQVRPVPEKRLPEVKEVPVRQLPPVEVPVAGPSKLPVFWAAAAVVAILFTAATWWTVTSDSPVGAQWSGFDLFGSTERKRYTLPKAMVTEPIAWTDTMPWSVPTDVFGVRELPIAGEEGPLVAVDLGQAPKTVAVPVTTNVATSSVQARYHIIGGCFLQKENADKFVADLQAKGFAASLLDRKGDLYRVAYGSYPQRSMALEALSAVRKEEAPEAWMLVK